MCVDKKNHNLNSLQVKPDLQLQFVCWFMLLLVFRIPLGSPFSQDGWATINCH